MSSQAVIFSVSESFAVAACCDVVDWGVETVVARLEISVEFGANSWPCWEKITSIAGSRVERGFGCDLGGTVTEIIGGTLDRLDSRV